MTYNKSTLYSIVGAALVAVVLFTGACSVGLKPLSSASADKTQISISVSHISPVISQIAADGNAVAKSVGQKAFAAADEIYFVLNRDGSFVNSWWVSFTEDPLETYFPPSGYQYVSSQSIAPGTGYQLNAYVYNYATSGSPVVSGSAAFDVASGEYKTVVVRCTPQLFNPISEGSQWGGQLAQTWTWDPYARGSEMWFQVNNITTFATDFRIIPDPTYGVDSQLYALIYTATGKFIAYAYPQYGGTAVALPTEPGQTYWICVLDFGVATSSNRYFTVWPVPAPIITANYNGNFSEPGWSNWPEQYTGYYYGDPLGLDQWYMYANNPAGGDYFPGWTFNADPNYLFKGPLDIGFMPDGLDGASVYLADTVNNGDGYGMDMTAWVYHSVVPSSMINLRFMVQSFTGGSLVPPYFEAPVKLKVYMGSWVYNPTLGYDEWVYGWHLLRGYSTNYADPIDATIPRNETIVPGTWIERKVRLEGAWTVDGLNIGQGTYIEQIGIECNGWSWQVVVDTAKLVYAESMGGY